MEALMSRRDERGRRSWASSTDAASMLVATQADGAVAVAVKSHPAQKYGVGVARVSYPGRVSISGTTSQHMIGIVLSPPVPTEHRIEGKSLQHDSGPGCLCICPAGAQHFTSFGGPVSGIVLQISPECFTLAKADLAVHDATLVERMGGRDPVLTRIARILDAEVAAGHPNGMLFWSNVTDELLGHLAEHHVSVAPARGRGKIGSSALKRLDNYIRDNLAGPLDLDSLAAVVGCNRFHFAHRFRAAVGVSPHRYVVRRRLQRACALLRAGVGSPAEIAAATGFSDQSHLSSWVRRIYRTTPKNLAPAADRRKNLQDRRRALD
jgi:AraC family transcriptional regulator